MNRTLEEVFEELWDNHSQYIDDNSFSFEKVADSVIMTKHDYDNLVDELKEIIKEGLPDA